MLVVVMVIVCAGCSCDDDDDDNNDNNDNDNDDNNDDNDDDNDDDDSAPPSDCQIIQCERPDYNHLPPEPTGACFPDECEESGWDWFCDGTMVRLLCHEAVVLDGKMWTRCSTYRNAHFCAACSAQVLEFCGYDDWRLPTYEEARSLYDPSRPWDTPDYWGDAYIRKPFRIYDSSSVWLFVSEDATVDDFGDRYNFFDDSRSTTASYACYTSEFFVRDLTDASPGVAAPE